MEIYEKIFARLEELQITQLELSRRTGIATSTICDWKKKKINPQSDKLVSICRALEMSVVDLLCSDDMVPSSERYLLRYYELFSKHVQTPKNKKRDNKRNASVIADENGSKIVLINDKKFKDLSKDDWNEVEEYLKQYIGEYYEIAYYAEKVFIGIDLPDDYFNSESRHAPKGHRRETKANDSQANSVLMPVAIPLNNNREENEEQRYSMDTKNGWYRYKIRFGIPVYDSAEELDSYNIFTAIMLVRRDADGRKYLYDFTTMKKETSDPLES